ncbi:MAG: DUF3866 family protein [Syntrophomonadales bacterium]|jgi:hypothetical protein
MIESKTGTVRQVTGRRPGLVELRVEVDGDIRRAVAYEEVTGPIEAGDRVVLNTTASSLALGSGGFDFVMVNLDRPEVELSGSGHIMKMRYTPWQCRVLSVEEAASPYHQLLQSVQDLAGIPVLVATLHSMLAPLCACLAAQGLQVAYVMTDAASLPLPWSRTVEQLKGSGLLKGTVTAGNAWGGDLEAVNIFSGLLAAHAVFEPDVIIVAMGPGIVGTGSKWGFSGIEQGVILNAVHSLGGLPVAVPRISFADQRERHRGISHHTLTVLEDVCQVRVKVPLPLLESAKASVIEGQVARSSIPAKHDVTYLDGGQVDEALMRYGLNPTTMGRNREEDHDFFLALGAAAQLCILHHGDSPHDAK